MVGDGGPALRVWRGPQAGASSGSSTETRRPVTTSAIPAAWPTSATRIVTGCQRSVLGDCRWSEADQQAADAEQGQRDERRDDGPDRRTRQDRRHGQQQRHDERQHLDQHREDGDRQRAADRRDEALPPVRDGLADRPVVVDDAEAGGVDDPDAAPGPGHGLGESQPGPSDRHDRARRPRPRRTPRAGRASSARRRRRGPRAARRSWMRARSGRSRRGASGSPAPTRARAERRHREPGDPGQEVEPPDQQLLDEDPRRDRREQGVRADEQQQVGVGLVGADPSDPGVALPLGWRRRRRHDAAIVSDRRDRRTRPRRRRPRPRPRGSSGPRRSGRGAP